MATHRKSISIPIIITTIIFTLSSSASPLTPDDPLPTPWPEQFHSTIFSNKSGKLALIDLWYDWPNGRNLNIFRDQLSNSLFYSLEWNNGTSFFFDNSGGRNCSSLQVEVGIVRPNWMAGANYLGQRILDGFVCNVWEKGQFDYYGEDVISRRPVQWLDNGRETHIMRFEAGAVLEDAKWQTPSYCFEKINTITRRNSKSA